MLGYGRSVLGATRHNDVDVTEALEGLKKAGKIESLRTHGLRRTFATVAEEVAACAVEERLINQRDSRDVAGSYTMVDDARLLEKMPWVKKVMRGSGSGAARHFELNA